MANDIYIKQRTIQGVFRKIRRSGITGSTWRSLVAYTIQSGLGSMWLKHHVTDGINVGMFVIEKNPHDPLDDLLFTTENYAKRQAKAAEVVVVDGKQ